LDDDVNRKKIKAGPGKQWVEGKDFRLAKEIKYIQRRAAEHDGRFVTIGPLALFSTETGDAWILDPSDQLAAWLPAMGTQSPSRRLFDAAGFRPRLPTARIFKPEHVLQLGYGQTARFGAKFGQSSLIGAPRCG
jgi:hypothetical protein